MTRTDIGALYSYFTGTIANGASLSEVFDMGQARAARIVIPSAWTTANLTFQWSGDGVTYSDVYDDAGTEYTVTVGGASREIILDAAKFLGVRWLKIRSGTTGTPVNQGAARTIGVVGLAIL